MVDSFEKTSTHLDICVCTCVCCMLEYLIKCHLLLIAYISIYIYQKVYKFSRYKFKVLLFPLMYFLNLFTYK